MRGGHQSGNGEKVQIVLTWLGGWMLNGERNQVTIGRMLQRVSVFTGGAEALVSCKGLCGSPGMMGEKGQAQGFL